MKKITSIGLPKIYGIKGEIRAFLPSFVEKLKKYNIDLFLEEGYGVEMGFTKEDYLKHNDTIKFVSSEEVYKKDLVIILKAPGYDKLEIMKKGSSLISMLHYDSRPKLVEKLKEKGINAYSMDSIVDDENNRMVVTYELTALGGVKVAFYEMKKRRKDFFSKDRGPIKVTIIGMGQLGMRAGRICMNHGDKEILNQIREKELAGVIVQYIGRDITKYKNLLEDIFKDTDLLVDATKRIDFSKYIVPNEYLKFLKEDAIILDLTADPYDTSVDPMQVKAIEGLPHGDLEKYVFEVDAQEYNDIPSEVCTKNRRVTISCSGWPGTLPKESMMVYEKKLLPFIDVLLRNDKEISIKSNNKYGRALYRGSLDYFLKENNI
ncbi:alanine dehydrogenase [Crassaminicella thermophila]|uniref:Alanine dehydrogenase n=1 Tax=Crassaminicella thermophila TaxID=2599308 RepID=A0A5C0SBQ9_CRATE|nr:alanine dehydrogenase [Crassaminicella thermophila]QEK10938.1 alanine dehydrogenase [Crassaminicella thermophila]